jgi:hypothetical protein
VAQGANAAAVVGSGGKYGIWGYGQTAGVYGSVTSNGDGIRGNSTLGHGVHGTSAGGDSAIFGSYQGTNAWPAGVLGESSASNGIGVKGWANTGASAIGVYGESTSGKAGYFKGNVQVTGSVSKTGGSFLIDHPLDPANRYLSHSFVESPDMKNVYDGVVTLDGRGRAEVELPEWFEALNRDFRYQLTPIGAAAPELHVAREIAGNRFAVGGGKPGMKVSWQVTGTRQDAWAEAHRIQVEEDKPEGERGTYLHPDLFGQPPELDVEHARHPQPADQVHEREVVQPER